MKKLIPIMIAATMLCVVFAAADTNVDADSEAYLWVGTTAIYGQDVEMPTWSYKPNTNTLTINGLILTGDQYHEYRDKDGNPSSAAIHYKGLNTLNLIIKGNNLINSDSRYGISNEGNGGLNISGNGTLTVSNVYKYDNALHVLYGSLTIDGGVLNLVSKLNSGSVYTTFDDLIINNGILNCSEGIGTGGGNVAINGGCINILDQEVGDVVVSANWDIVIDDSSHYEENVIYDHKPEWVDEIRAKQNGDVVISYIDGKTVTFDANGGTCSTVSEPTDELGKINSLPEATKDGYRFAGWYTESTGGERITDSTRFFEDTTVHAVWINAHLIEFDANGGEADVTFEVTDLEGKLRRMPCATRDGYRFAGWYTAKEGGERITESTVFHDDVTVYAVWINIHVIFFDAEGGDADMLFEITDKDGKLLKVPGAKRDGYIFDGWYTDPNGGEEITADTVFHTNTTAYAHWKMDTTIGSIAAGITAALALAIVAVSILFVRKH